MDQTLLIVADLVAVGLLVFALYFPRHRRRDLVVAYLTVNVGVLAVALVLGTGTIGAGLGLGLFGVLSIIRLRSSEIEQHEVAYYFAALAIGLLGGLGASLGWLRSASWRSCWACSPWATHCYSGRASRCSCSTAPSPTTASFASTSARCSAAASARRASTSSTSSTTRRR